MAFLALVFLLRRNIRTLTFSSHFYFFCLNLIFIIDSIGSCKFSKDCLNHTQCKRLRDKHCLCIHGDCVIRSKNLGEMEGTECQSYKDCGCSKNPKRCFCLAGFCKKEMWECRYSEPDACKKMKKCKKKNCSCRGIVHIILQP